MVDLNPSPVPEMWAEITQVGRRYWHVEIYERDLPELMPGLDSSRATERYCWTRERAERWARRQLAKRRADARVRASFAKPYVIGKAADDV